MQSQRSFFDAALFEKDGAAFIREDKVDEVLGRLIPKVHLSKGSYSCLGRAEQRDLVWNHMDQNHRPLIHRTYNEGMRVSLSERSAFSLTRFGNWGVIIPVFDGQHKENGFYQILSLFGLIIVICIIECNQTGVGTQMDIRWTIASHRLLRFLHPLLDRRLRRLNEVQNQEDEQIRDRRVELRAAGYTFNTDIPNFVNSNAIANNVVYPPLGKSHSVLLADMREGHAQRIELDDRAYVVRRAGTSVEIWPGVCPHEGAALEAGDLHGSMIRCPWHGLTFAPRRLGPGSPSVTLCGARLQLDETTLTIVAGQRNTL